MWISLFPLNILISISNYIWVTTQTTFSLCNSSRTFPLHYYLSSLACWIKIIYQQFSVIKRKQLKKVIRHAIMLWESFGERGQRLICPGSAACIWSCGLLTRIQVFITLELQSVRKLLQAHRFLSGAKKSGIPSGNWGRASPNLSRSTWCSHHPRDKERDRKGALDSELFLSGIEKCVLDTWPWYARVLLLPWEKVERGPGIPFKRVPMSFESVVFWWGKSYFDSLLKYAFFF